MELKGKTALITGGGIRLGRAFALRLAQEGVNLMVHYNSSAEPAEETVRQAQQQYGVQAVALMANFNDLDSVETLFTLAHQNVEQIDLLVNNSAIYLPGKGLETDRNTWEKQFRINLQAPFLLIQAFTRQLSDDCLGSVVNIADASTVQHKTSHFAYQLTKVALVEMTRMFALELAPRIRVNALGLGIMMPLAGKEDADLSSYTEQYVPLKRAGSPEIAAENMLHLLKSDFTTGAFLRVDGGQYL